MYSHSSKAVRLKFERQFHYSGILHFSWLHIGHKFVLGFEHKLSTKHVFSKIFDGPNYAKTFFLYHGIILLFTRQKFPTCVGNGKLSFAFKLSEQNGSLLIVGSIRSKNEQYTVLEYRQPKNLGYL